MTTDHPHALRRFNDWLGRFRVMKFLVRHPWISPVVAYSAIVATAIS